MKKNFILIVALLLTIGMSAAPVHADEVQFTTIDVRTPGMGGQAGNAFSQEAVLGGNVKVLIDSSSSGIAAHIKSHEYTFNEAYHLRIVAEEVFTGQQVIPRRNWPYTGVSYDNMKVDFLTTDTVEAIFFGTDRFSTPRKEGDVSIRVLAETNVDERQPPREVRKFTFKVTLQGVQGIKPDGSLVNLGNFIVLFHDQFIFMHDPAQMPKMVVCGGGCGGGIVYPLEEISATSPFGIFVEAGTGFSRLITTMQEYMVYLGLAEDEREICDAKDNDCPTGVDEDWAGGGMPCDESDVDECEEEPTIIEPINPGDNLTPNQGNI